jgi:hypothetical protein
MVKFPGWNLWMNAFALALHESAASSVNVVNVFLSLLIYGQLKP